MSGGGFRTGLWAYVAVYVFLMASILVETVVVVKGYAYSPELFVLSMSLVQVSLVALFYMHMIEEPASIKTLGAGTALLLAVLVSAAVTSVLACTPYAPI